MIDRFVFFMAYQPNGGYLKPENMNEAFFLHLLYRGNESVSSPLEVGWSVQLQSLTIFINVYPMQDTSATRGRGLLKNLLVWAERVK